MPPPSATPPSERRSWRSLQVWRESALDREYRLGRLLFTGPMGTFLGLTAGILTAQRWELPWAGPVVAGALGGFLVMFVLGHLESLVGTVDDTRGRGASLLLRLGINLGAGAFLGRVVGGLLGADGLTSLATGASLLVVISAVASRFFWGGWVEGMVDFLTGNRGVHRSPDHSFPAALVARGEVDQGLREYERLAAARRHDPAPLVHAAWTLRAHGHHDLALAWYRRALATRGIDAQGAAVAVRQVWEIEVGRRRDLEGPLPDLEAAVARFPDAPELAWARQELEELRREVGGGDAAR